MALLSNSPRPGFLICVLLAAALCLSAAALPAQDQPGAADASRAKLIEAAREIMQAQQYCALITLDEKGLPAVRTMNPFPPEEDMTVWIATSTRSRKVQQIKNNPHVCLYYSNHQIAIGYVCLNGTATLVDDPKEIQKRKRAYWDKAFDPGLKNLVLIKVVPESLSVINYKSGAGADSSTWRAPSVDFTARN